MPRNPRQPEVLAPAGSQEALLAALQSGADAVYFGLADGFNARARAANFALASLPATVATIRRAQARAYLTLNTLVFEAELEPLERVLRAAILAGIDALIVQDPAVCLLARAICPELELHGSTQMTLSSPRAAPFARDLGLTRIVVPRELSLAEIELFAQQTTLELEVFVHGALCVAWSGQCLSSEAWSGRSANRGECAQACRMPYELVVDGEVRATRDMRYLLSPKDLAGAFAVPELCRIGVHGLKIEGRQKGPHYVATATAGYRRWVDALTAGGEQSAARTQLGQDLQTMAIAYSRGFSPGFFAGADHQHLVEGRFPKSRGLLLGRVRDVDPEAGTVRVDATAQAHDDVPLPPLEARAGLGIVFDQGQPESKDEPGGPVFAAERVGADWVLRFGTPGPDLLRVRRGDRVWVTGDALAAQRTKDLVAAPPPSGRHPLHITVRGAAGAPLAVEFAGSMGSACAQSASPLAPSRGAGLDPALLGDKLLALGGTPFHGAHLDCTGLEPGLHLPVKELKELRRELVATLAGRLAAGPARSLDPRPALPRVRAALAVAAGAPSGVRCVPLCRSEAQLEAAIATGCTEVELDWMELVGLTKAFARARAHGLAVTLATLRVGKPGEESFDERVFKLAPDGILVRHWAALERCRELWPDGTGPALHGDFSLNVTNSLTARFLLQRGLATVTAAHDLDMPQLQALAAQMPTERLAVVVHHRLPTFHTEHCLYAHVLSEGRDFHTCGRPCERHQLAVRDHKAQVHPVIVDAGCRNTVFDATLQSAAPWLQPLAAGGVRRFRLEFVRESQQEATRVLRAYQELLAGRVAAEAVLQQTGAVGRFGVAEGGMKLLL